MPEVVDEGVTGFIRDDASELVDAFAGIERLDPAEIRAQVTRRFDAANMVEGYEAVYRATAEPGRPTIQTEAVPTPG